MEKTQDGTAALPVRQFTPEELAVFYQDLHPTPRPALSMSMHSPNQLKVMRARNQMNRAAGLPDQFEFDEVADTVLFHPEFSSRDLNQDSLDGAQASSTSEVGSADEFSEKDEENIGDIPDHNGHESRETENAKENAKENGDSAQEPNDSEGEDDNENGQNGEAEADSTEFERRYLLELEQKYEKGVLTLEEDADRAAIYAYSGVVPPVKVPADMISSFKVSNEECRSLGFSNRYLINEAGSTIQSLVSRPLDGAHASFSEVGSTEEFIEKDNTNDDAASEENTGDVGGAVGFISEWYQISGPFKASPPRKIRTTQTPPDTPPRPSPQNTLKSVSGKNDEAEANVTKVEGVVGEKRKSIAEVEAILSPKKARIEGTEEVTAAAINSNSVEAVVV